MKHLAYIAFGSNIGDRKAYILSAMDEMRERGMEFLKISTMYETEPYGVTDQPKFMNCVATVRTELSPIILMETLLEVEKSLGRVREKRWGPRVVDLDIVFYDHKIVSFANLIIPHSDMQNRAFVLEPLYEIDPHYVHPILHKTVAELLDDLKEAASN